MLNIYNGEFQVTTTQRRQIFDITPRVEDIVLSLAREHGTKQGILHLFNQHTTSGFHVNEADSGVMKDYIAHLERILPSNSDFEHDKIDPRKNGWSHIMTMSNLQTQLLLPIADGRLNFGQFQRVLYVELDGPMNGATFRDRTVVYTCLG